MQEISRTACLFFHWSLCLEQSPFLCVTCSNFAFLQVTAEDSPFLCLLLLTFPVVSSLPQENMCVCMYGWTASTSQWAPAYVCICVCGPVCVGMGGRCLMTNLCMLILCFLCVFFNLSMKCTHLWLIWERALCDPIININNNIDNCYVCTARSIILWKSNEESMCF